MNAAAFSSDISMKSASTDSQATQESFFDLSVAGKHRRVELSIPTEPIPLSKLLPQLQRVTDAVVSLGAEVAIDAGATISCRAGCGACCRQCVPVSEAEATRLNELVRAMPEPRRTEMVDRFEAAMTRLRESDSPKLQRLLCDPGGFTPSERTDAVIEYFRLGIPCPFLEDESCSIHADRPISCREYLVTSPAGNCQKPTPDTIDAAPTPVKISGVVYELEAEQRGDSARCLALVQAIEWSETRKDNPNSKPGNELAEDFFRILGEVEWQMQDESPDNQRMQQARLKQAGMTPEGIEQLLNGEPLKAEADRRIVADYLDRKWNR